MRIKEMNNIHAFVMFMLEQFQKQKINGNKISEFKSVEKWTNIKLLSPWPMLNDKSQTKFVIKKCFAIKSNGVKQHKRAQWINKKKSQFEQRLNLHSALDYYFVSRKKKRAFFRFNVPFKHSKLAEMLAFPWLRNEIDANIQLEFTQTQILTTK